MKKYRFLCLGTFNAIKLLIQSKFWEIREPREMQIPQIWYKIGLILFATAHLQNEKTLSCKQNFPPELLMNN